MHFCVWQPDPLLPGGLSVRERTGAGQWDGCAVSAGLADALFGSREVTGLELMVKGEKTSCHRCGGRKRMFSDLPGCDCFGCWIYSRFPGNRERKQPPRNNTESSARCRTFGKRRRAAANWHIASDHQCCRLDTINDCCTALPASAVETGPFGKDGTSGGCIRSASDGSAGAAGSLAALPRWLVPSRWSDMNFWMDLGNLVQQKSDGICILDKFDSGSTARRPNTCVRRLPAGAVGRGATAGTEKKLH